MNVVRVGIAQGSCMKVVEAMRRQFQTVKPAESVQRAAQTLAEGDEHALLVLDEGERLVGIVTERDITVRAVADAKPAAETQVSDIMSSEVFTCGPEDDAGELAGLLHQRQIEQAPVLDCDRLVGLLVLSDLAVEFAGARAASGD
jgi:CBS domain-containing protein